MVDRTNYLEVRKKYYQNVGNGLLFSMDSSAMRISVPFFSICRKAARWSMGVLTCFLASISVAQPVRPPESIAQPVRPPESIALRVAACIACHGREGTTGNSAYFPRLAGKPAGYLFNQLTSFRDGRRTNADMAYLVQHMSDAYLQEIAAYFAGLELPYPATPVTTDASRETLARGRKLVFEGDPARGLPACTQCHGTALTGVQPGIPALVGLPRLYLAAQLGAWVNDDRHALAPDCMAAIGRRLDAADVNAAASWLAIQPVPADARPTARLPTPLPMPCASMPASAVEAAPR